MHSLKTWKHYDHASHHDTERKHYESYISRFSKKAYHDCFTWPLKWIKNLNDEFKCCNVKEMLSNGCEMVMKTKKVEKIDNPLTTLLPSK